MKFTKHSKQLMSFFRNNMNYIHQTYKTDRIVIELYDEIMNVAYIKKYMTSLLLQKEFDLLIPFEK